MSLSYLINHELSYVLSYLISHELSYVLGTHFFVERNIVKLIIAVIFKVEKICDTNFCGYAKKSCKY